MKIQICGCKVTVNDMITFDVKGIEADVTATILGGILLGEHSDAVKKAIDKTLVDSPFLEFDTVHIKLAGIGKLYTVNVNSHNVDVVYREHKCNPYVTTFDTLNEAKVHIDRKLSPKLLEPKHQGTDWMFFSKGEKYKLFRKINSSWIFENEKYDSDKQLKAAMWKEFEGC